MIVTNLIGVSDKEFLRDGIQCQENAIISGSKPQAEFWFEWVFSFSLLMAL